MILTDLFHRYTEMFDIPEPCDDISTVLALIAKRLHALERGIYVCVVFLSQRHPMCSIGVS